MADFTVQGIVDIDVSRGLRNLTRFQSKLKQVVGDIRKTSRELDRLDGRQVNIDVVVQNSEITELKEQLNSIRDETVNITADADTAGALSDMEQLEADIRALGNDDVEVKVELAGAAKAIADAERLNTELDAALNEHRVIDVDTSKLDEAELGVMGLTKAIGAPGFSLISVIAALAPALIPIGAVLGGVAAGLTGSITVATAGVAAFGILSINTFKDVGKAVKLLATDTSTLDKAGLKDYNKQVEELKKTSPLIYQAAQRVMDLKDAWEKASNSIKPEVLQAVNQALTTAKYLLDQLQQTAEPVAQSIDVLFMKMDAGLRSKDWRKFFNYIQRNAGTFVLVWGIAVGNFITGIANMIRAFDPLTKWFNKGLLGMSRDFVKWSENLRQNQGFKDFVAYVKENGPAVAHFIGAAIDAIIGLTVALAPLGTKVLDVVNKTLDMYNAFKEAHPQAATLATNIGLIAIALSPFLKMLGPLLPALVGVLGPVGILAAAVVILAGGLAFLNTKTKSYLPMIESLKGLWEAVKDTGKDLWGIIKDLYSQLQNSGAIDQFQQGFKDLFDNLKQILPVIKPLARILGEVLVGAIIALGYAFHASMMVVKTTVGIISWVVHKIVDFFKWLYDVLVGHSIIPDLVHAIGRWFGILFNIVSAPLRLLIHFIISEWKLAANIVRSVVGAIVSFVRGHFQSMKAAVSTIMALIKAIFQGRWKDAYNIAKSILSNIVSTVRDRISAAKDAVRDKMADAKQAFSDKLHDMVDAARSIMSNVKDAIMHPLDSIDLSGAGARIIGSLIGGLSSRLGDLRSMASEAASLIGKFIPGSPVKEGPLKVLNRGYAGKQIVKMLAGGMKKNMHHVRNAAQETANAAMVHARGDYFGSMNAVAAGGSVAAANRRHGRGGNTYNIKVDVPFGLLNPAAVGEAIKEALKAYEEIGG